MDQKITESHLPGQYLDIALLPGQYLDITLAAGQYKIYCPGSRAIYLAFDPPTQSVTYVYTHHRTNNKIIILLYCMFKQDFEEISDDLSPPLYCT